VEQVFNQPPKTFGTARNGNTRGPGYLNIDMSAFKDFHVVREKTVGFRFDAFNAFNIASYGKSRHWNYRQQFRQFLI